MTIFDANVWIAFFDRDDSQHDKAERLLTEQLPTGQVGITEYIILEVGTVLMVKAGKTTVKTFLTRVFDNSEVGVILSDKQFFEEVLYTFKIIKQTNFRLLTLRFWSWLENTR